MRKYRDMAQSQPAEYWLQKHRHCRRQQVANHPLVAGFKHGSLASLPHVGLAGINPYRVAHDAVEDGNDDWRRVPFPWSPTGS